MMNVVFDIGNVLVDYRLKEFLAEQGFSGDMIKRILKASIMSPYWEMFERSEVTEEEVIKLFGSLDPEIEDDIYRAYKNIKGMLVIRDFAIPWIKQLKAEGYGVYYLSNYSKKAYYECDDSVAFMEYTDGGVVSWQEGMTKPDPNFYKRFLEKYNLKAEDCIFVDDTEANVIAARELGFKGIVFDSYEEVDKKIKAIV